MTTTRSPETRSLDNPPRSTPAKGPRARPPLGDAVPTLRALVIGVDHYPALDAQSQLEGCVNDALAMRRFLIEHVHVPEERVLLLLSPRPEAAARASAEGAREANGAAIRAAFEQIAGEVEEGEDVIVFYAGHGVRVSNPETKQHVYGFAPSDLVTSPTGFGNMVIGRQINRFIRRLTERGAVPTVIADTCHSASSVRGLNVFKSRRLMPPGGGSAWPLSGAEWAAFTGAHPALAGEPIPRPSGAKGASGWVGEEAGFRDWVMLSACRDVEVAEEHAFERATKDGTVTEIRGLFTGCLLEELARVPEHAIPDLRWSDLYPNVRSAVQAIGSQRPTLEGRPERTVFGGAWTPFEPGFVVDPGEQEGSLVVAGGLLQGLDEGAELDVYPPDTPDFDAAGAATAHAVIERSAPVSSAARLTSGGPVAPSSRAVLVKPSPRAERARVLISTAERAVIPDAVIGGISGAKGASDLLTIVEEGPAAVEVRRLPKGRWGMVPFTESLDPPTADDVIAYLPSAPAAAPLAFQQAVGAAIGAGLVQWARYLRVRDRRHVEPKLRAVIDVGLRVGPVGSAAVTDCHPISPGPDGSYEVEDEAAVFVEIALRRTMPFRLFVGVIVCSDDGNTFVVWPPTGGDPSAGGVGGKESDLIPGQTLFIGRDQQDNPVVPVVREDQRQSLYTLKVIACTVRPGEPPPDLRPMELEATVQEIVDALAPGKKGEIGGRDAKVKRPEAPQLWGTWELPVRVVRRG